MKKLKVSRNTVRILSSSLLFQVGGGAQQTETTGQQPSVFSELHPQQCVAYLTEATCLTHNCI